jgi:hypothetical protein
MLKTVIAGMAILCGTFVWAQDPLVPYYKYTRTLVASTDLGAKNYLMVPILLRLGPADLLVGYKRGYSHYGDPQADFEILRMDPLTEKISPDKIDLRKADLNFQDGELARFANGDVSCYIDVQAPLKPGEKPRAIRLGLLEYRSTDGGRTFHEAGKVGLVDGVEYGYAFEAITHGNSTWMLVMRFSNLPGGKRISAKAPEHAGSVDVIRTDDNGKHWRLVRDLSAEFGNVPINESSFVRAGEGYLVATRGYDSHQYLQLADAGFKMTKQVDLTSTYPFIRSYVGRPRIFEHDGRYYLLGRNWIQPGAMQPLGNRQEAARNPANGPMRLSLFRVDPKTLAIDQHVILDNAEGENVIDGYYAVPYWQERNGRQYLNVVTYKRAFSRTPDILRLEFDWDEVR